MSKILSIKRDLMTILAFIMLGIGMFCAGILTSTSVKETQLMRDGKSEALRWARDLARAVENDPGDAARAFFDHNFFIKRGATVSRVFAFNAYDKNGRLFYSAGPANWPSLKISSRILQSPVTRYHRTQRKPAGKLYAANSAAALSNFAAIVMPFHSARDYLGSIVAFVDQSEEAVSLASSFNIIAAITGLMLFVAFAIFVLVVFSKTRERVKAEERIRYLSGHDELTGLANRKSFNSHLAQALAARERSGDHLAAIIIDIDRFKDVNDALGHNAGDSVLRYITELLKSNIREGDFAARIGSDQFALTLASIKRPQQAAVFVATLSEALSAPIWINGEQIACTVSIGAALAPGDADDATILMRHANLALGRAKADGGNTFKFFERGMDVAFIRRRDCEADLRRAIDSDQFELFYQPQVDFGSETVRGYEALIRWNHPRDGMVSPGFFIPLAEETEMIVPIGEWVLRRACKDAASWPKPLNVSVNLSPVQFKRGGIVELFRTVLEETGLDPHRLEVEITESLLISNVGNVVEDLEGLSDLGVSIAMDDFGTGYSSLSYISSFPFNKIKIDKSFVHSMTRDAAILGIVKCIIAMGRSLDVAITAEGVETAEQRDLLKELGCTLAQGFLYGRPMSASDCTRQVGQPLKLNPSGKQRILAAGSAA